jgi:hypothetical protein
MPADSTPDDLLATPATAFQSGRVLATGPLLDVARAVKAAFDADPTLQTLTFDDRTGAQIDFDLGGTPDEFVERLTARAKYQAWLDEERRLEQPPGAVVAREVTLLPRHWAWLDAQPGDASQALRRLVDDARRRDAGQTEARRARERAYAFITAVGGDRAGFEDAIRALFADDRSRFEIAIADWPHALREYALRLGWPGA